MIQTSQSQLVSIVLTTYNGEKYLATQLDSLFEQTYLNIEVIAVDDCSADNTAVILRQYAVRHKRMKVFVNETNIGYISNFDKGCSLSAGAYIALCDQDDYWEKDKIQKMVSAIEDFAMVYCDSYVCDEDLQKTGKKISGVVNCRNWYSCLEQTIYCRIYGHATLITRELYNYAHPFLSAIPHDWWLAYTATLHGGIRYLDEPLNYYRQHSSNVFGAVGGKKKENQNEKSRLEKQKIRERVNAFYNTCPAGRVMEKQVLYNLRESYRDFSINNNVKRFLLFLKYRDVFLRVKKHSALHRFLFCFKMFMKIK